MGRCIAESETAVATHSVTLTYGERDGRADHARAAVLTYSDVQGYFKLLRRHGYPVRYFAVGELGAAKGRAHWHAVLYWLGRVPPHEEAKRFMERRWKHGFSFWEKCSPASIRYVCKYVQKDLGRGSQSYLAMSKKPPLGAQYFNDLALRYAKRGLAPQEAYYSFGDVRDEKGYPVKFLLRDVSLDRFCQAYLDHWDRLYPGSHPPVSSVIEDYCDRVARSDTTWTPSSFKARTRPWIPVPEDRVMEFSPSHNLWFYMEGGDRMWWSFDSEGRRAWQRKIVTEDQADLFREIAEERSDPVGYRRMRDGTR